MSIPKAVVLLAVAWFGSALVTFAVIALSGGSGHDRLQQVAFSDFLSLVDRGSVEEIHVKGRVATFRIRDNPKLQVEKQTIGPVDDEAQVRALRPSNADESPPKVVFER